MEERILQAALAGLLHDVGKFAQRAGEQVSSEWQSKKAEFKYQHALHTWYFIDKYVPKDFQVGVLAAYHHKPQNAEQLRIRLADQLSASERDSGRERDDSDRAIHPRQLHPIFWRVVADEGKSKHPFAGQDKFFFGLNPLTVDEDVVFARPEPLTPDSQVWKRYEDLWMAFCNEAKRSGETNLSLQDYTEAMQALLQRYAWCIPSAYFDAVPDISLYDHSRMTAALAACLVELEDNKIHALNAAWQKGSGAELDDPVALLVGGDISGVQDFIYTISSKGAAKMLRGRSFYLQLLTEAVVRFALRRLGLPYTNVIYSGGGHFYLLAPLNARDKLTYIQAEVGKILYQQHGAQLYLVLGQVPVPVRGFSAGKLQDYWQKMHNQLTIAKNRRYAELGESLYDVFKLPTHGGNPDDTCSVCGDDSRGAEDWAEEEGQAKICPLCRSFEKEIGKHLPETDFLALKFGEPQANSGKADTALNILRLFGMEAQFLKDVGEKVETALGQQIVLWALDDPQNGRWPQTSALAPRWLRYAVNRVPHHATFDELQEKTESGFKRLGVLRMDVDNLGPVFKDGLGELFSLSRMAALSSQISLFFEGWLKRIVEHKDWQNLVYTVYSGGDDLFLLAPWEKVPPLALKIVDDFAAYTGRHPGLHISGGMAFIGGKYPIYQAAEDAKEAEELAKQDGKNAFAFLNKRWAWTDFRELSGRKDLLKDLVEKGESQGERGGPKSILQVLRSLAKMEEEAVEMRGRPVWGRWMWLGTYQLARMEERYTKNETLKGKLAEVRRKLGDFQNITAWGAAARWAQLETRKVSNQKQEVEHE